MAILTRYPTSNAVVLAGGWTNPNNAHTDDTTYATASPIKNAVGDGIVSEWSGFDFSTLPADATLNSVYVYVNGRLSAADALHVWHCYVMDNTTTLVTHNSLGLTASDADYAVGSGDIKASLTVANLKSSTFKVRVGADRGNTNNAYTHNLDHIRVVVDYTAVTLGTISDLSATSISYNQINLGWSDVTGETSYLVHRSTTDGFTPSGTTAGSGTCIAVQAAGSTSYNDTAVPAPSTLYYYKVQPYDGTNTTTSNQASATSKDLELGAADISSSATISFTGYLALSSLREEFDTFTWTTDLNEGTAESVSGNLRLSVNAVAGAYASTYTNVGYFFNNEMVVVKIGALPSSSENHAVVSIGFNATKWQMFEITGNAIQSSVSSPLVVEQIYNFSPANPPLYLRYYKSGTTIDWSILLKDRTLIDMGSGTLATNLPHTFLISLDTPTGVAGTFDIASVGIVYPVEIYSISQITADGSNEKSAGADVNCVSTITAEAALEITSAADISSSSTVDATALVRGVQLGQADLPVIASVAVTGALTISAASTSESAVSVQVSGIREITGLVSLGAAAAIGAFAVLDYMAAVELAAAVSLTAAGDVTSSGTQTALAASQTVNEGWHTETGSTVEADLLAALQATDSSFIETNSDPSSTDYEIVLEEIMSAMGIELTYQYGKRNADEIGGTLTVQLRSPDGLSLLRQWVHNNIGVYPQVVIQDVSDLSISGAHRVRFIADM